MSSDNILIQANGLSKAYRLYAHPQDRLKQALFGRFGREYGQVFWALRDISFELKRGEMLGIVGRNGSGKSTLLQILAGTLHPSSGSLQVSGRLTALLELGSGFNYEFSGRENIYLNASIIGLSPDELNEKLDDIIAFADIGDFIDQPVKLYSSGMFVRLAFAITTGLSPDILLVDEALAVGDVFFRQKCYQRLKDLRDSGTAVIFVSHNAGEVEQLCDTALLLHKGSMVSQGIPTAVVKKYYLIRQDENFSQNVLENVAAATMATVPGQEKNWPEDMMFSKIEDEKQVHEHRARLVRYAVLDHHGQPKNNFMQGEVAYFYYEFEALSSLELPLGGIVLTNQFGVHVHGKNGLQFNLNVPYRIEKGDLIRIRQQITLNVSAGDYSFEFGLIELSPELYEKRSYLPIQIITSGIRRLCHVPQAGSVTVYDRLEGKPSAFMHYGLCDLPGDMECHIVPATSTHDYKTTG